MQLCAIHVLMNVLNMMMTIAEKQQIAAENVLMNVKWFNQNKVLSFLVVGL